MTICNMSIECGARAGLIAPDETTFAYLSGKPHAPKDWDAAEAYWRTLPTDSGAKFDAEVAVDVGLLKPMVTWGTNPGQAVQIGERIPRLHDLATDEQSSAMRALEYIALPAGAPIEGTPIDWAFLGSCTNGRIDDLRVAAGIVRGKRVAEGVTFYVVPGSEAVMKQARSEGLDRIFEEAGAEFRMPGCSMCLGMNDDLVPPGQRCISSSNRNFVGRQGPGSRTHLASPATVAASALSGRITSPEEYL